jgi:ubiquinone/menaquinone biosynthesis C-methylase UbiE
MDYKFKKENYDFWLSRINSDMPEKVCSNDVALDKLESLQILDKLNNNSKILEIGCGNGLLYDQIRKEYQVSKYVGTDFVKDLIDICNKKKNPKDNFLQLDMTEVKDSDFDDEYDFIISKRAIQNVIDTNLQLEVIDNFGKFLSSNGQMILVESSSEAQDNINELRAKYNLDKILPPFHNLFFKDEEIKNYKFNNVKLVEIIPFASDFFYITRLIYAIYAKDFLNEAPKYSHPMQDIALSLTSNSLTKKLSQIQTYIFKKI